MTLEQIKAVETAIKALEFYLSCEEKDAHMERVYGDGTYIQFNKSYRGPSKAKLALNAMREIKE